jgi:hypothetical protein
MSRKIRYSGYSFDSLLTPATIFGANLYDWWRPEEITADNGDPQSTWVSQGVNGATFQAGSGQEPTVIDNAIGTHKALSFNGTTDFMEVPLSTGMYNFLHNALGFIYMVFRINPASSSTLYPLLSNSGGGSGNIGIWFGHENRSTQNKAIRTVVARGVVGSLVALNLTGDNYFETQEYNVLFNIFDPQNATAADRNEVLVNFSNSVKNNTQANTPSMSDASFNLRLGELVNFYTNMNLAEIGIIDTLPTAQQLTDLQTYLENKYGTFPI